MLPGDGAGETELSSGLSEQHAGLSAVHAARCDFENIEREGPAAANALGVPEGLGVGAEAVGDEIDFQGFREIQPWACSASESLGLRLRCCHTCSSLMDAKRKPPGRRILRNSMSQVSKWSERCVKTLIA